MIARSQAEMELGEVSEVARRIHLIRLKSRLFASKFLHIDLYSA